MKLDDYSICNKIKEADFINFYLKHINIDRQALPTMFDIDSPSYKVGAMLCDFKEATLKLPNKDFRTLVLSEKSTKNLKNYRVPKDIRIEVLRTLPNRFDIIQVSDTKCFKYVKTDTALGVYTYFRETKNSNPTHTHFFFIDFESGKFIADKSNTLTGRELKYGDKEALIEEFYGEFMVCVTYIELTDVSYDICYSNSKRGHIMKGNDLNNTLKYNVIQVNTNWNITKLHIGDTFEVSEHWRLQPYGVGRTKYKYIFINKFEKTGIIKRKAGKDLNS